MDEELIELLKKRSPDGLETLMRRYGALIRYVVEPILPDSRDAEECVSDVYMKILSAAGALDPDRSLKAYVTATARNTAVSMARRRRVEETGLDERTPGRSDPEEEYLRRERAEALKRALSKLSAYDRGLVYRKYYYRQSTRQIAAELGITERAVEGKLYRIKRKLREFL